MKTISAQTRVITCNAEAGATNRNDVRTLQRDQRLESQEEFTRLSWECCIGRIVVERGYG